MPQFILTDLLVTFLIVAGFERLIAFYCDGKYTQITFSGLLWGLSIIVKPFALFYVFCLSIFIIISNLKKWRHSLRAAALFTLAFSLPIGSYVVRNKITYGYYFLTVRDRINLYFYFLPKVITEVEGLDNDDALEKIKERGKYAVTEFASGKGWENMDKYFFKTITEHPLASLKVWFFNNMKTLLGLYTNQLKLLLSERVKGGDCSFFRLPGGWKDRAKAYLTFGTESKFVLFMGLWEVIWSILRYIAVAIALVYLLYNILIVSSVDNILRSHIVSRKTRMPQAIILIGMIGGLFIFGILGLILGPLIVSYLLLLLDFYRTKKSPGLIEQLPLVKKRK